MTSPRWLAPEPRDPEQPFWQPELQTLAREARRELQLQRLRQMVERILATPVPHFVCKLESAGIQSADDIKSLNDLSQIPLTRKQELRDSEAEHAPLGDYRFTDLRSCVRIGQSTGTTGTPTTMVWTRRDLWIEYESAARMFWRHGYRPGMIATHAHPAYLYGGGAMLSGAYEYFGLVNLWVPPPDSDELAEQGIRSWMRFKPDIPFMGFSLGRYFEVCAKLKLDPVKDAGLDFSAMGRASGGKGMPLVTAGLECYAYLGGEGAEAPGAHLNEDWAIVQAVDPATGLEVPDGEWGNLVVTTLDRDNGMLRYDLEEACAVIRDDCPCGETTARGYWGGRFKDLLSSQGKRFQVTELENALRRVVEVTQPSLEWVAVRPKHETDALQVRVELGEGDRKRAADKCAAAIFDELGVEAQLEVVERGSLPRSGYKAQRIVEA